MKKKYQKLYQHRPQIAQANLCVINAEKSAAENGVTLWSIFSRNGLSQWHAAMAPAMASSNATEQWRPSNGTKQWRPAMAPNVNPAKVVASIRQFHPAMASSQGPQQWHPLHLRDTLGARDWKMPYRFIVMLLSFFYHVIYQLFVMYLSFIFQLSCFYHLIVHLFITYLYIIFSHVFIIFEHVFIMILLFSFLFYFLFLNIFTIRFSLCLFVLVHVYLFEIIFYHCLLKMRFHVLPFISSMLADSV